MKILLKSRAFPPDGAIPDKYTCEGLGASPPLVWYLRGRKDNRVVSLALLMEDSGRSDPFVHWILFNLSPKIKELPEGIPAIPTLTKYPWLRYMGIQGRNDYGKPGYAPPCPLTGHRRSYYFRLFALDIPLDLPPMASKSEFREAIEGHVVEKGEMKGVYRR